jgi:hypothetical protein
MSTATTSPSSGPPPGAARVGSRFVARVTNTISEPSAVIAGWPAPRSAATVRRVSPSATCTALTSTVEPSMRSWRYTWVGQAVAHTGSSAPLTRLVADEAKAT